MNRTRKSLLLAFGTSLLIILTQLIAPVPAQEPAAPTIIIETTSTPTEAQPDETESQPPESPALSPEELARQEKLIEADQLFLEGKISEAEKLYREVKAPFTTKLTDQERKAAILDPQQLSPAGKVYWRESTAGIAQNLQTRTVVPLQLLVEQYPEFIPGHIRFAEVLKQYNRPQEALEVLERASSLYPQESTLIQARITALAEAQKWMEASLAARQFALLNPNHPQASEFKDLADKNLNNFKSHIKSEIRGNTIANVITGALGYAVTGGLQGPFSAIDSTIMLFRGEEAIGESIATQAKRQLDLIEDETVTAYVNDIGEKLVKVAGRHDFKYEFFVIPQEDLNAFALPGGKIFINAGAIAKTNSEAELAGLIGHELSHTVLSHGFQLVTQGNLIANVTQYLPLGGTIGQLFALNYSRDMERQADNFGTRLIVAGGYAADGLRNLMVTLEKQQRNLIPLWLSSHPGGSERVSYLENLITRGNYNRYAYEGVERHLEVQTRVKQLLEEKKSREQKKSRS
ncbi:MULTISPECIES: M48 family metallopeptidase [unclassified Nodularia (in: cyanobacteria)]|uniref:M48 family metallopeptidase n=1 Tax=unclassified Nodularia (in: cyanobacteria) TaxID=2656917 RepID=UPI00187E78EA|nr:MULTISPECIES: M48 family metallopeptidase [unclassified Nodularia (in: cyanobacteria)]MBE9201387.1 M48 family metalloprotease [Nodularia sp. LEGE 06071]MCC2691529.1 M48 family metalloprotease [Nodularia sp. LEGE 04288]